MASTTDFIAAIELGSSKIAGIIGKKNSDGSIRILAYAKEDSSSFIRKGIIFNLNKTEQSLISIINKLKRSIDCPIGKVYVGISGQSLHTVNNVITRDLKEEVIISQELIDSITDENRKTSLPDMDILDVAPQEYKIGNILQADPVGIPSKYIEGRFMNIVAQSTVKKKLDHCFREAKIEIADVFISPLITANAVLSESDIRSGCALVDFGADTTTVSVYKDNILRFLAVLPLGGNSITKDITSLQVEEHEAEELKINYGNALPEQDNEEEAKDSGLLKHIDKDFDLSLLNDIVSARAEEIVANVWNQIQLSSYEDKLLAGVVITGGGANLKHMDELLRIKSQLEKIRIARFPRFEVDAPTGVLLNDGTQNTLLGLVQAGTENCSQLQQQEPARQDVFVEPKTLFDNDEDLIRQEEEARVAKKLRDAEEKKRKEEEKKRKEEEKRKKQEIKKNRPSWFKDAVDKITREIFSDEEMK